MSAPTPLNNNTTINSWIHAAPQPAAPPAFAAPLLHPRSPQGAASQSSNQRASKAETPPTDPSGETVRVDKQSVKRPPLAWAYGWTADKADKCDISDAARKSCSGPDCLLSCLADSCHGQESASCEFTIDCAAEITADLVAGDQLCDPKSIEHRTFQTDRDGLVTINVIKIAVGESCKPPPCVK
jgi:hypothetical protein